MTSTTPKVMPYKYILFLSMLFITIDLAAVSVAYKMVSLNDLLKINSAATFIFPVTYALGDIVTEVYGYNMAKKLIWLSLFLQFIFSIIITAAIHLPSPDFFQNTDAYITVFGSITRFVIAGTAANIISNFINIYMISKLKIPFEGKYFWARSILSTITSGFLLVAIVMGIAFSGKGMDITQMWIMFKSSYSCEVIYAFILVIPAAFFARFLKINEKVDVYDHSTNFNPFCFKQ